VWLGTRIVKGSGKPVRLKVGYKTPESLLSELTKSVGRGGVRIESRRTLPAGTRFVFELRAAGVKEPVEVLGTVLSVSESAPGKYVLHIRYEPPTAPNRGLDAVLARIFAAPETKRKHPRVPLNVRAVEESPGSPDYRLHDISRGGVGIDVEAPHLPRHVKVGAPFTLQMKLSTGMLKAQGEVIWAVNPTGEGAALRPRIGVAWGKLAPRMVDLLDSLVFLSALPAPPWIARIAFGENAG